MHEGPTTINRVSAATLGGSIAVIAVWLLTLNGISPPAEIVVAVSTIANFAVSAVWSKFGGIG